MKKLKEIRAEIVYLDKGLRFSSIDKFIPIWVVGYILTKWFSELGATDYSFIFLWWAGIYIIMYFITSVVIPSRIDLWKKYYKLIEQELENLE